ncbi:AAA family ATPase [soil metagenome]
MKGITHLILVDPDESSRFENQRVISGVGSLWIAEVCRSYAEAPRAVSESAAELVLVVLDSGLEAALEAIRGILRTCPKAVVVPASRSRDGDTILKALRAGAREFLPLPLEPDELVGVAERLVARDEHVSTNGVIEAQVIAVTGAAGGVGCTTIAVNLASALAKVPGSSVALVDFDLLLGTVDTSLDIIAEHNLLDVASEVDRLDLMLLKRALTRHASGIHVLPGPPMMEDAARIDPEALRRVLNLLRQAFSVVVIDTSKGFQATDFVAFEQADTILLVVELELGCLRNSSRLIQSFRQFDGLADKVRIVVNRVGSTTEEISLKKAEETLGTRVSWQIPNASHHISLSRAKGVPLDSAAPGCRAHRAMLDIAHNFTPPGVEAEAKPARRRFSALFF